MYYPVFCFDLTPTDFIAFSDSPAIGVISHDDAVTWKLMSQPPSFVVRSAVWHTGRRRWFAVGNSTNKASSSSDGDIWEDVTIPASNNGAGYTRIRFNGSYLCAVSSSFGASPGKSIVSSTGEAGTWTAGNMLTFSLAPSLAWSPVLELWACLGDANDVGKRCQTSPDGVVWTSRTLDQALSKAIGGIWGGTKFIFTTAGGQLTTSSNGTTWPNWVLGNHSGYNLANTGEVIVGVSGSSAFATPDEGTSWNSYTIGTGLSDYREVAYNGRVLCATSYLDPGPPYGKLSATSNDGGQTWIERVNMLGFSNWVVTASNFSFGA